MYTMRRADNLSGFLQQAIEPPKPMCKRPVEVLDDNGETVAVVLQTSIEPGKQREAMDTFCKTLNRLDLNLFYLTRAIRTRQRERGLLAIMLNTCDRASLQSVLERL